MAHRLVSDSKTLSSFIFFSYMESRRDPGKVCSQSPCTGPGFVRAVPPPIHLHAALGPGRPPPMHCGFLATGALASKGEGIVREPQRDGREEERELGPISLPPRFSLQLCPIHGGSLLGGCPPTLHSPPLTPQMQGPVLAQVLLSVAGPHPYPALSPLITSPLNPRDVC